MTKDEALKLALQLISNLRTHSWTVADEQLVITAIKEALAQPEPWEKFCDSNCVWTDHHPDCKLAEQEPVAWKETDEVECPVCKDKGFPWPKCGHITYLEPTPPQRTWVGLTWEDANEIAIEHDVRPSTVKAIEAKLKEKNDG